MIKINNKGLIALAMVFLAAAPLLFADAASDKIDSSIDRILKDSGMDEQIAQIPGIFSQIFSEEDTSDPAVQKIVGIMRNHIQSADFRDEVRKALRTGYIDANFKTFADFYNTDAAKRITKDELDNFGNDGKDDSDKIDFDGLPEKRKALLDHFYKASNSAEVQFEMVDAVLRGFYSALNFILPEENRIDESVVNDSLAQIRRDTFSDETKLKSLKRFALTYQNINDVDFQRYIAFLDTKAGKWIAGAFMKGFGKALGDAMKDAAADIANEFGAETKS